MYNSSWRACKAYFMFDTSFSLSSNFRNQNEIFHILLKNCCVGTNFLVLVYYEYQLFSGRQNWHFETVKWSPIRGSEGSITLDIHESVYRYTTTKITNKMHYIDSFIIPSQLYMFWSMFSPIIRSTWLYLQYLVVFTHVAAGWCLVWTLPEAVNTVKCSWWWAKTSPETCRAN